jgi:hypothetical protein
MPRVTGRQMCTLSDSDINSLTDEVNDLFVEARDEIEYADESIGTVNYNEDMDGAKEAVRRYVPGGLRPSLMR